MACAVVAEGGVDDAGSLENWSAPCRRLGSVLEPRRRGLPKLKRTFFSRFSFVISKRRASRSFYWYARLKDTRLGSDWVCLLETSVETRLV